MLPHPTLKKLKLFLRVAHREISDSCRAASTAWLIVAAEYAAPKPLSIFTTDTPGEQEFSMPSNAAIPPKLAP
jgi:hypothetical protein